MIDINDLKSHSALSLLEGYEGINPYIKKLKNEFIKNKKIQLTENQSRYIVENHDKEPQYINRVIGITPYLGEELKKLDVSPSQLKELRSLLSDDQINNYKKWAKKFYLLAYSKMNLTNR